MTQNTDTSNSVYTNDQATVLHSLHEDNKRLHAQVVELQSKVDELNNSINVWHAHALDAEDRATTAERKLAQLTETPPEFPQDMQGKPVTAEVSYYNYDMDAAPKGGKLLVLNHGGVATFAVLSDKNKRDFRAWAPLPKVRKGRR